jgi:hypothetical protein
MIESDPCCHDERKTQSIQREKAIRETGYLGNTDQVLIRFSGEGRNPVLSNIWTPGFAFASAALNASTDSSVAQAQSADSAAYQSNLII